MAERHDHVAVNRRDFDRPPIHEDAIGALQIAQRPPAVGKQHHRVAAADVDVLDAQLALAIAADMERPHEPLNGPVSHAHP